MILKEVKVRRAKGGQKTKVYIFESGENILDNLANRHSRPHVAYRKEVLPLVKEWLKTNQPEVEDLEVTRSISWSQKCGCKCGCSPGFILDYYGCHDIYVTISN
jgi:hypothetical protein